MDTSDRPTGLSETSPTSDRPTGLSETSPRVGAATMIRDIRSNDALRRFVVEESRDLEIQDFIDPAIIRDGWREAAEAARALIDGHTGRVGIHGPFIGFQIDVGEPDIQAIARERLLNGVMAAAALSGKDRQPHMVVHSPYTTWDWHNLDTRVGARASRLERVHATLGPAVARAREEGVVVVVENIEDKNPLDRAELMDALGSDAVQLSIDTGHAHYAHTMTGAPSVDHYVRLAGVHLAHIHLQDADGFADRHWRIGEGTISFIEIFRALAETKATPRLILEMKRSDDVLPSAKFLQNLGLCR